MVLLPRAHLSSEEREAIALGIAPRRSLTEMRGGSVVRCRGLSRYDRDIAVRMLQGTRLVVFQTAQVPMLRVRCNGTTIKPLDYVPIRQALVPGSPRAESNKEVRWLSIDLPSAGWASTA